MFETVDLIPGNSDTPDEFALSAAEMAAHSVTPSSMTRALTEALAPFAAFLREGHGFALVSEGHDEVSIIGLKNTNTSQS